MIVDSILNSIGIIALTATSLTHTIWLTKLSRRVLELEFPSRTKADR